MKIIANGVEARDKLKAGIDKLADTVVATLGPRGRNVGLEKAWGEISVVNDGVTIAKDVELEDPIENFGAKLVREASEKTNDRAGDGTTTSTLLARAIIEEGFKMTTTSAENFVPRINPMKLKIELEEASKLVLDQIDNLSVPVTTLEQKIQVASVSAQNEELGTMIAQAIDKVGEDGAVLINKSNTVNTVVEHHEGMMFDRGWLSAHLVTDKERMVAEINSPKILITDHRVSNIHELLPLIETLVTTKKMIDLVIICGGADGSALGSLIINKKNGSLNTLIVQAPEFGVYQQDMLEDIAKLTGGKFISKALGFKLSDVTFEDLGDADAVISTEDTTTIVEGKGDPKEKAKRVKEIKAQIKASDSEYNKEKLATRLAKLSSGVTTIRVGAATETELEEKRLRAEDALNATRAAISEGIVPGGGLIALQASQALEGVKTIGAMVLRKVLEQPMLTVLENAGLDSVSILQKVKKGKLEKGFDVISEKMVNMIEKGIIDPTRVAKSSLKNAISVACMVLTTEAVVVNKPEEDKK